METIMRICYSFAILATLAAGTHAAEFDIRDSDGNVIIAADNIKTYDWATHTILLKPGARPALADDERLTVGQRLVSGIPFSVCVDGKAIYDGVFTTPASSKTFLTPVIVYLPIAYDTAMLQDGLAIQLGYPTDKHFKGQDSRADKRIEKALRSAGKLINSSDAAHTEWLAGILKEIQTLKPGMTRADLLKICTEEGGLSNRYERRYVHHACPYIKVDVKFDDTSPEANGLTERPQDKISQISKPFLEWSIAD
jgi:hypothetical protein